MRRDRPEQQQGLVSPSVLQTHLPDMHSEPTFIDTPARQQLIQAALILRPELSRSKRRLHRDAWATIETYITISLKVMDRTPFAEIKSVAVTEEIKARLDGRQV
jgi:hypothetical protein